MTRLTLELIDEQAQQLADEAECLSLPLQELAACRLLAPWQSTEEGHAGVEFEDAMEYVFEKNPELYRRLA